MRRWLQVASLSLVLRAPIVIIAPLVYSIAKGGDIPEQWVGIATGIAVACFAVGAAVTSWLARRLSEQALIRLCLFTCAAGIVVRSVGGVGSFVAGSLIIGIAVGVLNVVMPGYAARSGNERAPASSAVAFGLNVGALLAALAVAVFGPVIDNWRIIAMLPIVIIVVAFLLPDVRAQAPRAVSRPLTSLTLRQLSGGRTIAVVALFMGVQATGYYVFLSWVPYALMAEGATELVASLVLASNQLGQIVAAVALGVTATVNVRHSAWTAGVCIIAGGAGSLLLLGQQPVVMVLAGLILGCGNGAALATAIQLIVQVSGDPQITSHVSVVAHVAGYLMAGATPMLIGFVAGSSGFLTLLVLISVGVAILLVALMSVARRQPLVQRA